MSVSVEIDMTKQEWSCPEVASAARFAQRAMSSFDASHNVHHAFRVHRLAIHLAESVEEPVNRLVVELSALLHDVYDKKFWPNETGHEVCTLLAKNLRSDIGLSDEAVIKEVVQIADGISYSKQQQMGLLSSHRSIEFNIVQDADRLEALGAIGIARCIYFSGCRGLSLIECREHFDSKLLKLLPLMRTKRGLQIARERDEFMRSFFQQYDREISLSNANFG